MRVSKQAVHFGAGNIGRGFLGQLYFESGYATTFVDVVGPVVVALNERKSYPLRLVGEGASSDGRPTLDLEIGRVSALHAAEREKVAELLARADLASTAVGVGALPKIAPLIAAGVTLRFQDPHAPALDIIVCENLIDAGPFMREQVRQHLDVGLHEIYDKKVGFVEASIGRMVPVMTEKERAEDPLLVCVEPYCELPVDANGFKGPIPALAHMEPKPNFGAYVERKLFVHNMSHAVAGYLGYLRGHEFIWQAIQDPRVRAKVDGALDETCRGLTAKHGLDPAGLKAHANDLLRRYQNKALGDQVARIAKDPLRKLGPKDRLVGAGLMCLEQGIEPRHVAFAAAAAIRYDHPEDPAAQSLQAVLRERGLGGVITEVCHLDADAPLAALIRAQEVFLFEEGWLRRP